MTLEPRDGFNAPCIITSQRQARPHRLIDEQAHPFLRIVLRGAQFLDDDAPFFFQLMSIDKRVADHISQNIHNIKQILAWDASRVTGQFLSGTGVEYSPNPFYSL